MNSSHTTRPALGAASPSSAIHKQSRRSSPKAADQVKKRGERIDKTGRNKKGAPHVRIYGWLLSSPEWLGASCADRASLLAILSAYNGSNNGAIRMGARRLAKVRNPDKPDGKGHSAAAERLHSLAKAGLIIRANTPSKGSFEHRHEAEWLLPFLPDHRKGKDAKVTKAWEGRASQKSPFFQLFREVIDTAAWSALSDASQVLMLHLGVEAMKREKWQRIDPLTLSVKEMAELLNVSHDTAHRAFRDLEAKGFVMRHRDGRALVGKRITGSFSVDWLACRPEVGVFHAPRRRFVSWHYGDNFAAPTVAASRPRRAKPETCNQAAEPSPEMRREPAKPETPPAPQPVADTTDTTSIDTEETIDMANITDPRVTAHIIQGLHYMTLDRFDKPFPMDEEHAQMAIYVAADAVGPINAVATFRAAAVDAIAKATTVKDIHPAVVASIRALRPAKATKTRHSLAAAVGM